MIFTIYFLNDEISCIGVEHEGEKHCTGDIRSQDYKDKTNVAVVVSRLTADGNPLVDLRGQMEMFCKDALEKSPDDPWATKVEVDIEPYKQMTDSSRGYTLLFIKSDALLFENRKKYAK